jgi:rhodanese-related sulfurtransferase
MAIAVFKGDVSPQEAWQGLAETPAAVLLDVRTSAEWTFVGGPDLASLEKSVFKIGWQSFPGMGRNESFVEDVKAAGITEDQPIYLICRSGVRSKAAGIELAEHGFTTYNIADGFEGQLAPNGHRGVGGWRTDGLPWKQT